MSSFQREFAATPVLRRADCDVRELQASCLGKEAFASRRETHRILTRWAAQGRDLTDVRAYECARCGRWHIGKRH